MVYTSFHGEIMHCGKHVDQVLREYFPNYNYRGVFIDIGAYEPKNISNSYHFEKNGWDVYCIEANPLLIDNLKKERKNVLNYAVYNENKQRIEFNIVKSKPGCGGGGPRMASASAVELDPKIMKMCDGSIEDIIKIGVEQKTLTSIFEEDLAHVQNIDILKIDVEGGEMNVLKGINFDKYRPKLMIIEDLFDTPDIRNYLEQYEYILDRKLDYNYIFKLQN